MRKILGMVLVIVLATSSIAFAATTMKSINVSPNTATVTVNGSKITADNFNYNGTIYVPLRAVSESLGNDVSWDKGTKTAAIKGSNQNIDKMYAYTCLAYEYGMIQNYASLAQNLIAKYDLLPSDTKKILLDSITSYSLNSANNSHYRYLRLNDADINKHYEIIRDYCLGLQDCASKLTESNLSDAELGRYNNTLLQVQQSCVTATTEVMKYANSSMGF